MLVELSQKSSSSTTSSGYPASSVAKNSADYLAYINNVKMHFLDATWNADGGTNNWYTTNSMGVGYQPYTWLNVFMVQTTAILANLGLASATDITRAQQVISRLITSPCYAHGSWTHHMAGTSDYHSAVDQPVAESLYYAHKYRTALGLSAGTISTIYNILTVNVVSNYVYPNGPLSITGTMNNQDTAKFQYNRISYGYLAGNTALGLVLSACIKRFVQYMDTPFGASNNGANTLSGLFADFGWRYIEAMPWQSLEYSEMSVGGALLFHPELITAANLTSAEILKMKAWQRHNFGMWQKNGYPNWDTTWSSGRIHSISYWLWSLRALVAIARDTGLNMNADDAKYAKAMLDHSMDTMQHMDVWNSDPTGDYSIARDPMGVLWSTYGGGAFQGTIKYNNVKESSMAKYIMELAMAVDLGVADSASTESPNIWGWNWYTRDVHISTPYYSAASLPWAPLVSLTAWAADAVQGPGDGISRLQLPTNEILTNMGGYNSEAFNFLISRNSVTDINTGSTTAGVPTSQEIWRDGIAQTRTSYDTQTIQTSFASSIKSLVKRNGSNYRSEVETEFFNDKITWTHRAIRTGTAGTGQVFISFPCVKNCVMEYIPVTGAKTVVWNGTALTPAGSPSATVCKYIHLKWAQWAAGVMLIPAGGVLATGAKVTASNTVPSGYPDRQPNPDRTLLIYLADGAALMGDVSLTYDVKFTDGTDAYADAVFNGTAGTIAGLPRYFGSVVGKKKSSLMCVGSKGVLR